MGDFMIVTTNEIPGYAIEECYGYISSSFVVGANWFRDFGSSITDLVGGVSTGYTEEINSLKERARVTIKNKAQLLGLNGVVGFKIDIDPVFGSGYSMFMVSATGTGVKLKGMEKQLEKEEIAIRSRLSNLYSKVDSKVRLEGVSILETKNYELEAVLLEIGLENKDGVIEKIIEECDNGKLICLTGDLVKRETLKEYFSYGDMKNVKEILNRNITETKGKIAKELDLIDYKIILEELEKVKDAKEELALLYVLDAKPKYISKEEYLNLVKLQKYLKEKYSSEVEIKTSGFKKRESWICKKCGAGTELERETCYSCGTNRYGTSSRFNPEGKFVSVEEKFKFLDELEKILSEMYN